MLVVVLSHLMQSFASHMEEMQAFKLRQAELASPKDSLIVFPYLALMWIFLLLSPVLLTGHQGSLLPSWHARDCMLLGPSSLKDPFLTPCAKGCVLLLNRWQLFHMPLICSFLISRLFYSQHVQNNSEQTELIRED